MMQTGWRDLEIKTPPEKLGYFVLLLFQEEPRQGDKGALLRNPLRTSVTWKAGGSGSSPISSVILGNSCPSLSLSFPSCQRRRLDAAAEKSLPALRRVLSLFPRGVMVEDADKGPSSFSSRRERNVSPLRVWPQVVLKESQLQCHMGEVCGWFWPFLPLSFLVGPSSGASSLSLCQSIESPPFPFPSLPPPPPHPFSPSFQTPSSLTSAMAASLREADHSSLPVVWGVCC